MIQLNVISGVRLRDGYHNARVKTFRKEDVVIVGSEANNAIIRDSSKKTARLYVVGETVAQVAYLLDAVTQVKVNMLQTVAANGTTQGSATLLTQFIARVTTADSSNYAVKTGKATELDVTYMVINATAITLTVYPFSGDRFNGLATNVGVQVAPGTTLSFIVKGIS